jgi:hypothetical protein
VGGVEHFGVWAVGEICARQFHIANADITRIEQFKTVEAPEKSRFSAARRTYQRHQIAFFYIYRDIVEHSVTAIVEALAKIFHHDQGFFRRIKHNHIASPAKNKKKRMIRPFRES